MSDLIEDGRAPWSYQCEAQRERGLDDCEVVRSITFYQPEVEVGDHRKTTNRIASAKQKARHPLCWFMMDASPEVMAMSAVCDVGLTSQRKAGRDPMMQ